jgi:predicted ribosomally synthesized peptide with nif11-like leader
MSSDQAKAFWEAAQADPSLQQELATAADLDEVVAIARQAGFDFSAEEIAQIRAGLAISEEDLDMFSGGRGEVIGDGDYACIYGCPSA